MDPEVRHDNPYSRLMALSKMGIVENYSDIKSKTVFVIGIGGVGSTVCEMLTRCGIGKLVIYDYDKVELSNMNRLFYTPAQAGMSKVEAAVQTLQAINPDVSFEFFNHDITLSENYLKLKEKINVEKPELILCCVDNYSARMSINKLCNELD